MEIEFIVNEDKSRTVVCASCGGMVHADYMEDHRAWHQSIATNIKDASMAVLEVVRNEMRGWLDVVSEDVRQIGAILSKDSESDQEHSSVGPRKS